MRNVLKALGIIALVAVIGFSMAACGGGDSGGGGGGGSSGELPYYIRYDIWQHDSGIELVFLANTVNVKSSSGSAPATYTYKTSSWELDKMLLHFKTSGDQAAFVVVENINPFSCSVTSASFSEIGIKSNGWSKFNPVFNDFEFFLKKDPEYCYYLSSYSSTNKTTVTEVTIPSKIDINGLPVMGISSRVFSDCPNLATITIPDSVISIAGDAFSGTAWFNNQSNGLVYAGKVAYTYKGTMSANTNITFLNDTKGIASYAFYNYTNLTGVTIPNSVSIGNNAFTGCTSLTSVTFQGMVTLPFYNTDNPFPGDLRDKYYAGGKGTYTRTNDSSTWTKK